MWLRPPLAAFAMLCIGFVDDTLSYYGLSDSMPLMRQHVFAPLLHGDGPVLDDDRYKIRRILCIGCWGRDCNAEFPCWGRFFLVEMPFVLPSSSSSSRNEYY